MQSIATFSSYVYKPSSNKFKLNIWRRNQVPYMQDEINALQTARRGLPEPIKLKSFPAPIERELPQLNNQINTDALYKTYRNMPDSHEVGLVRGLTDKGDILSTGVIQGQEGSINLPYLPAIDPATQYKYDRTKHFNQLTYVHSHPNDTAHLPREFQTTLQSPSIADVFSGLEGQASQAVKGSKHRRSYAISDLYSSAGKQPIVYKYDIPEYGNKPAGHPIRDMIDTTDFHDILNHNPRYPPFTDRYGDYRQAQLDKQKTFGDTPGIRGVVERKLGKKPSTTQQLLNNYNYNKNKVFKHLNTDVTTYEPGDYV